MSKRHADETLVMLEARALPSNGKRPKPISACSVDIPFQLCLEYLDGSPWIEWIYFEQVWNQLSDKPKSPPSDLADRHAVTHLRSRLAACCRTTAIDLVSLLSPLVVLTGSALLAWLLGLDPWSTEWKSGDLDILVARPIEHVLDGILPPSTSARAQTLSCSDRTYCRRLHDRVDSKKLHLVPTHGRERIVVNFISIFDSIVDYRYGREEDLEAEPTLHDYVCDRFDLTICMVSFDGTRLSIHRGRPEDRVALACMQSSIADWCRPSSILKARIDAYQRRSITVQLTDNMSRALSTIVPVSPHDLVIHDTLHDLRQQFNQLMTPSIRSQFPSGPDDDNSRLDWYHGSYSRLGENEDAGSQTRMLAQFLIASEWLVSIWDDDDFQSRLASRMRSLDYHWSTKPASLQPRYRAELYALSLATQQKLPTVSHWPRSIQSLINTLQSSSLGDVCHTLMSAHALTLPDESRQTGPPYTRWFQACVIANLSCCLRNSY